MHDFEELLRVASLGAEMKMAAYVVSMYVWGYLIEQSANFSLSFVFTRSPPLLISDLLAEQLSA